MMKNKRQRINTTAILLVGFVILFIFSRVYFVKSEIIYDKKNSTHGTFYIKGDIVVIADDIVVKNNTSKDLNFYMYADVREDKGLVIEEFAPACEKDTLTKQKYQIKAKTESTFTAYFKAKKGDKITKYDRRPPNDIKFEIVD
ncbi:MAG: hypothetical protein APF77_04425 [Clostridia bacterium BRH_c25]|nr:MAG: hypothetical protein APF77_04425 [Clostridia bacterium BRH_c25]